ncbi:MAG: DUF1295 domain-containing protein [Myxococcaceae bacterium]
MSALLLAITLAALWLVSVRIKDSSIIDLFWGPAFSVLFWPTALAHGLTPRSILVGALVSFWGLRLGLYLARRNLGHGEDKRYTAMRARHGPAWWWRSLFIVFALQGALAWIVSWPIRAVAEQPASDWTVIDAVATALTLAGIAFEAIGDAQLRAFKNDPANKGVVMDRGLWRYTRHPNYFGNCLLWIGLGVFGLQTGAWWSAIGPVVMTFLLVRVSGKALLEKDLSQRPGYAAYIARTSGFVPWPPRG